MTLSTAYKDVIPLDKLIKEVTSFCVMKKPEVPILKTKI